MLIKLAFELTMYLRIAGTVFAKQSSSIRQALMRENS